MDDRRELRRLTPQGIDLARQHLADIRANPSKSLEVPDDILYHNRCSKHFANISLERRPFPTRRDAVNYLTPRLAPIQHQIVDHFGVWSWLGMFYFPEIAPKKDGQAKLSTRDETFVLVNEGRTFQRRYVHYLWAAWRLGQHHPEADFLLDTPLHDFSDLADRVFSYNRIFNSQGIVQLFINLYTDGQELKRNYSRSPGGLRHLINTLDQLERIYDVYGMQVDNLKRILPADFEPWLTPSSA